MKAEKLYIKATQKISFKAFAIVVFVLLFIAERIPCLSVSELELSDVSESFSLAEIGFRAVVKFFDYFGFSEPAVIEVISCLALGMIVLGLASLALSFFGYRIMQVINTIVSFVGFLASVAFGILVTVFVLSLPESDYGEVMSAGLNFTLWLPAVLFLIGMVFTYAYAKLPGYTMAEGRFFSAFAAALNPKRFLSTFKKVDDTEQLFRISVPLKKKKYATLSEPKAVRKSKKAERKMKRAEKKNAKNPNVSHGGTKKPAEKLTPLELALKKREHAERVANARADEENRLLRARATAVKKTVNTGSGNKTSRKSTAERERALELARRRMEHAETVAERDLY